MKKLSEVVSTGKLVGSAGAAFRKTSTSKPDDLRDSSGKDVGASRNYAHEKAAVSRADKARQDREAKIEKRTKEAEQRAKETLKMAKESTELSGTTARVKVQNVARPDDAEPTSEKSKLSKQAEIKNKIIEETPMSKTDFGLPHSLIMAARSVMEKKTQVDLEPETNDRVDDNDDDDDVKKESKHTTPKSDKEKKLAALAHPKDKITHKDVLVGRGVLKKEETEVDIDSLTEEQLEEVLKKSQPAGEWIKDFVHSKDPKFAGKSKKERMRMALGAYYAKQRNEEVEELDEISKAKVQSYMTAAKASKKAAVANKDPSTLVKRMGGIDTAKSKLGQQTGTSRGGYGSARVFKQPRVAATEEVNVELTAEELERIESIAAQLDEANPTIVSAPIRGANQDQSGFGVKKDVADYTISDSKKVKVKEEVGLEEAIKIGSKVKMHAPGKDYHGQVGRVGEIAHGLFKGAAKKYTVDYGADGKKSITLSKDNVKLHKEEVELDEARGRPKKSGEAPEGDDTAKHPIQQLHKIASGIQGNEPPFEHKDGSKTKVSKQLARHITAVYGSLRTSQDKDDFAKSLHANRQSMMDTVSKHVR